jgi:hypothetical protein
MAIVQLEGLGKLKNLVTKYSGEYLDLKERKYLTGE